MKEKGTQPEVSIVIPAYNAEDTLKRCLDSVLSQDFEALEVILVNDGSTDRTLEIAQPYQAFPNFTLIDEARGGVAKARWKAICASKGRYLVFVDADDHIAPGMISKMHEKAETTGAEIVVCGWYRVSGGIAAPEFPYEGIDSETGIQATKRIIIDKTGTTALWNKMYRKDLITPEEYEKTVAFSNSEDTLLLALTMKKAAIVSYLGEPLYFYADNPGSVTRKPTTASLADYVEVQSKLLEFFSSSRIPMWSRAAHCSFAVSLIGILRSPDFLSNEPVFHELKVEIRQKLGEVPIFPMLKTGRVRIPFDLFLVKAGLFDYTYSLWGSFLFKPLRKLRKWLAQKPLNE